MTARGRVLLPPEIRLPGYAGPTLFTAEARDGQVITLARFEPALASHDLSESEVLGTMRETQGPAATAYAAFCRLATGAVVQVDLDAPHRARLANSSVDQLLASLTAVAEAWLHVADNTAADSVGESIRAKLAAIDPVALGTDDAFWPSFLDTIG